MNPMSSPASQTQWYLAREGQQFGPLSEVELARIIELGHLQPTDLLWREGFPDWRPALVVFPPRKPAAARPAGPARFPAAPGPQARGQREPSPVRQGQVLGTGAIGPAARQSQVPRGRYAEPYEEGSPRGGKLKRFILLLIVLGALAAAGLYAYPDRKELISYLKALPSRLPASLFGADAVGTGADRKNIEASPLRGFSGASEAIDATLQGTPLWRVIKREFPDWYAERLKEAASLAAENKGDAAIAQRMAQALVALRRQNAAHALAASFPHLRAIASSFFANLVELRKQSVEACYEFVSHGEASPLIISLMQRPAQATHLQAQLVDVFEAIADGRKTPRVYPQPRKTDYDALAADLTSKRGWSQADLQLFSDERALARAGPEKVCQLVHDWFAAQLAVKDPDTQLRLLVDSLKPVVAG
jgi:hypothetical protein